MLVMSSLVNAQSPEKNLPVFKSQISHANVYFGTGAQLTHAVDVSFSKGNQEVVISNVSTSLDINTIQITCPENVVLLSHRFVPKTETNTYINPAIAKMDDSLKMYNKQIKNLQTNYALQEELLGKAAKLIEGYTGTTKNSYGEEVIKLVDFYTAKIQTYRSTMNEMNSKVEDINEKIIDINNRRSLALTTNKTINKTLGQIILQVLAKEATKAEVELSYFTNYAGWTPSYEMRVKSLDNNLKLGYKANVAQNTGLDWVNVKLTLSTNNPNQSNQTPILSAWYLQTYVPQLYNQIAKSKQLAAANTVQSYNLDEVVVANYGTMAKKDFTSNVSNYLQVKESQLYTSFDIDLPYDIPADGKSYSVAIKDEELKASYKHYAVPKLDKDAFLMAEISDWENLDLLPGEANIIMDGKYIGKSYIDPNSTSDTLNFNLGRDKRISIKRQLVKDNSKTKIKGDYKTETFTYEIVVKNNKKQTVNLLLKDQYPLSREKEIETILLDDGGAEVNTELGILNFKLSIPAGEMVKKKFSYSVKYLKDKTIAGLR